MTKVERTAPKKIWLVIGEDCPTNVDFKELVEVTWCEDKIDSNSIAYVRATAKAEPAVPEGYKLVIVPQESTDEPDWDECKRQAEVVTGLKVEQHTFSILKREVRRWIAGKEAQPAVATPEPTAENVWFDPLQGGFVPPPIAEPAVATDAQEAAERFLEAPDVQDEGGINAYYSRELVLHCIESALSSDQPDGEKGENVCRHCDRHPCQCGDGLPDSAKPAGAPTDIAGIQSPFNACMFRDTCRALAASAKPDTDANPAAPWLTEAHMLCTDQGIAQGHIQYRLLGLRAKLAEASAKPAGEPVAYTEPGALEQLREGSDTMLIAKTEPCAGCDVPLYAGAQPPVAEPQCTCCGCGGCKLCLSGMNRCPKHSAAAQPPVAEGRREPDGLMWSVERQQMVRAPTAQPPVDGAQERYQELLYAVASKYPGETRHQTALRYIQQAESSRQVSAALSAGKGEGEAT